MRRATVPDETAIVPPLGRQALARCCSGTRNVDVRMLLSATHNPASTAFGRHHSLALKEAGIPMTTYDPGPQIAQIGPITLGTPNLPVSLAFFRDTLGMEVVLQTDDAAYLRGYQELVHHSLVLRSNEHAQVETYSFRVRRPEDVELYQEQLESQEIEVLELPVGHEPGRGSAVRFLWPGAQHPIELYYDIEKSITSDPALRSALPSSSSRRRGLGVRRLDHYNMQCSPSNINAAEAWLREQFGFKRREYVHLPENGQLLASWMSVTPQVHDLALMANQEGKNAQLHHVAFNLENQSDLLTAADVIADLDVQVDMGPGKHGIGQAMYLYVRDPGSGHRVELYAGGYLIFDPDWDALEWTPTTIKDGLTWFGDGVPFGQPSSMDETTDGAGLTPASLSRV